jgi:hypothetical protein
LNRINTLNDYGTLPLNLGDYDKASDIYQECLYFWEATEYKPGMAKAYREQSLKLYRELGDLVSIAACLNNLGVTCQIR